MQVVVGGSQRPDPVTWQGVRVSGIIAPDSQHIIRLVSDRAAAGLEPAQPPSLDDVQQPLRLCASIVSVCGRRGCDLPSCAAGKKSEHGIASCRDIVCLYVYSSVDDVPITKKNKTTYNIYT